MRITIEFTDVYDGVEHDRTDQIEVASVPTASEIESGCGHDWAEENILPHTGDGNASLKDAGYFARIIAAPESPHMVGVEFEWGV